MSQVQAIYEYLKAGNSLTGLEALKLFGSMKLATRISEIKDQGVDIKDETVHDQATGKHYKKYWIEQPTYKEVGKQLAWEGCKNGKRISV